MDASDNREATISGQAGSSGQVVPEENADQPSADYLQWLESRSMLHQADHLADLVTRRRHLSRPAGSGQRHDQPVWGTAKAGAPGAHPRSHYVLGFGRAGLTHRQPGRPRRQEITQSPYREHA